MPTTCLAMPKSFIGNPSAILAIIFSATSSSAPITVYTFSYSQKNNFGSKNQEKYADPESTSFRHFLTKIRTVLCITIHIRVDSH